MRIVIDHIRCAGLGMCEAEAPDLFEVQEDGTLLLLQEQPGEDARASTEAAVLSCPTEALRIVED